jgi:hypothetical protein
MDKKDLDKIYKDIKSYYIKQGSEEKLAHIYALIDSYHAGIWDYEFDFSKNLNLRNEIKKIISKYRYEKNTSTTIILQVLYEILTDNIILAEQKKEDSKEITVKHHLVIQDGELIDKIKIEKG